jgi:hypothetical protein
VEQAKINMYKAMGGKEWIKGDYHRIYYDTFEVYGFETRGCNDSAKLDGKDISNRLASELGRKLDGKVFLDIKANVWRSQGLDDETSKYMFRTLKEKFKKEQEKSL